MKNIFLIILSILALSCKAQIVDVNTSAVRMTQGGYYAQDSNHEFTPFLGTWEGTWDNKKITFYFSKIEQYYVNHPRLGHYYEDFVIGKYIIIDLSTGAIIEDTTNYTDMDDISIKSAVLIRNKNLLKFLYSNNHIAGDCGILSDVFLYRDVNNPNILTYKYFIDSYDYYDCPNIDATNINSIPVNIPKQDLVLHKI